MHCSRLLTVMALMATSACAETTERQAAGYFASLTSENLTQWKLPRRLREISGLALTVDGRLLAITDELAIVFELDYHTGGLTKAFALGQPTVRADFEGIAVSPTNVFLITSDGEVYVTAEGSEGERVSYQHYTTGIGKACEVEGLAYDSASACLLIACKHARSKALKKTITVYTWSPTKRDPPQILFQIDEREVAAGFDEKQFNPSAIAIDPLDGGYLLLASRQRAIAKVGSDGRLIASARLPDADRHRQPEGLAVASMRTLIIADEGGKGRARLGVYRQFK